MQRVAGRYARKRSRRGTANEVEGITRSCDKPIHAD
jgi:hypothetical protein